ncbi:Transcriptional regulator [Desulfamplus magnetovallimortis]|uniref:Transcriptional regulator n=1 Tax=Desulfamplus magnetovallimortis TaxID=1246637 RepID=A0A1W1H693_9BACT|nr:TetR/AcrR family transcriptional regulator [Desulfamplus magnetovallimortis]SLM27888.1 Transcriptional regulator [Desulfamplus magnetovallimortis]
MAKTTRGTGEDNRQKILDAAMSLIAENGVDKTSLAMIAKKSGVSKGTLYYYYASKNDLVFDIADFNVDKISSAILSIGNMENGTASWEQLVKAFFDYLLSAEGRNRLHLYLVREAISGNELLQKRFRKTYAQWFSMVEDTYIKHNGNDKDARTKAKFFVAVLEGFILQKLLDVEKIDIEDILKMINKLS